VRSCGHSFVLSIGTASLAFHSFPMHDEAKVEDLPWFLSELIGTFICRKCGLNEQRTLKIPDEWANRALHFNKTQP